MMTNGLALVGAEHVNALRLAIETELHTLAYACPWADSHAALSWVNAQAQGSRTLSALDVLRKVVADALAGKPLPWEVGPPRRRPVGLLTAAEFSL